MRKHFVDDIPKFTKFPDFINKFDVYKAACSNIRKAPKQKIQILMLKGILPNMWKIKVFTGIKTFH